VVAQAVLIDEVTRSFELYQRIRAYFMTLSQVSIEKPEWFPLQIAMIASDQILSSISNTYRGQIPPVQFLLEAWANTIHYFSETMRIQKTRTAGEIIGTLNTWEHWWKYVPSESGDAVAPAAVADNKALENEMSSMRGQIQHWKNEANNYKQQAARGRQQGNGDNNRQPDGQPPKKAAKGPHWVPKNARKGGGGKGGGRGGGGRPNSRKRGGQR